MVGGCLAGRGSTLGTADPLVQGDSQLHRPFHGWCSGFFWQRREESQSSSAANSTHSIQSFGMFPQSLALDRREASPDADQLSSRTRLNIHRVHETVVPDWTVSAYLPRPICIVEE